MGMGASFPGDAAAVATGAVGDEVRCVRDELYSEERVAMGVAGMLALTLGFWAWVFVVLVRDAVA